MSRTLACLSFCVCGFLGAAVRGDTVGSISEVPAKNGAQTVAATPGDIIKITIAIADVDDIPRTSILSGTSAVRFGLVVKEQALYSAFVLAQSIGTTEIAYTYVPKGSTTAQTIIVTINVTSTPPARLINIAFNGDLTDVATGKPPVGGIRVGDVLRFDTGTAEGTQVAVGVTGDALAKQSIVVESKKEVVYFSAITAGSAKFNVSYPEHPEQGYLSPPLTVSYR